MLYKFDDFDLDLQNFELRRVGVVQHVEPLVFDLLCYFAENAGRLVSRDEIVENVWKGRIVSDATISGCVKSARKALGDSGGEQAYIRTLRRRGFQFAAEVTLLEPAASPLLSVISGDPQPAVSRPELHSSQGKPTIAVLPFQILGDPGAYAGLADAIPHELISALSRLRWLFVIARGSSFQFRSFATDVMAVGQNLNVRYALSGSLEAFGTKITVGVELAEVASGGVLWGERFTTAFDDVHEIRSQVVSCVVSALELQIPAHEADLAQTLMPENLDAWQTFHLGLKQAYTFTKEGNVAATVHFQRAVEQDPLFARAHAGLSFVEFQNAILYDVADPAASVVNARRFAERSVELDPLDPFINYNMGRCFWLERDVSAGMPWLRRAISISPNYAQGMYAKGLAEIMCDSSEDAERSADLAIELSPLDPLLYAMRGVRAISHIARAEYADAAHWAEASANSPNAHVHVAIVALVAHGHNGDDERAQAWAKTIRRHWHDMTQEIFFNTFQFPRSDLKQRFSQMLTRYGIS